MPSRYLKESIKRSAQIDSLTCFEEVVFYRLLVTVDDYGRYYANPAILKSDLFPLKENITKKSVEDATLALARKGLITLYTVEETPYLFLNTFTKHNKPRAESSKFPDPVSTCGQMYTSANSCPQMSADAPVFVFDNRIRNSYSERESAPAHTRGELTAYGSLQNVLLTEEEYKKLVDTIPDAKERIDTFGAKLAAKGYHYENHFAAIWLWYQQDKEKGGTGSFDVDDFFQAALARTYQNT